MINTAENALKRFLSTLNVNTDDPHFIETPARVRKAYAELLSGAAEEKAPVLKTFPLKGRPSLLFKGPIYTYSVCPHHLLPYEIAGYFAYIPNEVVVGISKPARLLEWASKRLIIQEEIMELFLVEFQKAIMPKGMALYLRGGHVCEMARGAKQRTSKTITAIRSGVLAVATTWTQDYNITLQHELQNAD